MQEYKFEQLLDRGEVAMAYVPWQYLTYIYEDLEEAFMNGTIFPELNKPFEGRRVIKWQIHLTIQEANYSMIFR